MIELPKDHEGREIPLDTEVLYDNNGMKFNVDEFRLCALPSSRTSFWTIRGVFGDEEEKCNFLPHLLHLVQPDSWKRLLDDLGMVEDYVDTSALNGPACIYMHNADKSCNTCKLYGGTPCVSKMCADIADRIRKLRGEGE